MMKKSIAIALLACLPLAAGADELDQRKQTAAGLVKEFAGTLQGKLQGAMKEGGPLNAIAVCNTSAPGVAAELSEKSGWHVARTSLKVRNPANTPDAWETKVLEQFEARKAKGEDLQSMSFAEVVSEGGRKEFRFMKAIPTGEVCLKCHGGTLDGAVAAKLDALYPHDQARGFKLGDLRGAFTLRQPL